MKNSSAEKQPASEVEDLPQDGVSVEQVGKDGVPQPEHSASPHGEDIDPKEIADFLSKATHTYGPTGGTPNTGRDGSGQMGAKKSTLVSFLGMASKWYGGAAEVNNAVAKLGLGKVSDAAAVGAVVAKGVSGLASVAGTILQGGDTDQVIREAFHGVKQAAQEQTANLACGEGAAKDAGHLV